MRPSRRRAPSSSLSASCGHRAGAAKPSRRRRFAGAQAASSSGEAESSESGVRTATGGRKGGAGTKRDCERKVTERGADLGAKKQET